VERLYVLILNHWVKNYTLPQITSLASPRRRRCDRGLKSWKLHDHIKYDKISFWILETMIMADIERMTITMPTEMAAIVKNAVDTGDYASSSEVVRAALRDWKLKRTLQLEELATLKEDIDLGLADIAAGRVQDFNVDLIVERGRKLLASRSSSV
jgi:antitoxin ParD1/3/4